MGRGQSADSAVLQSGFSGVFGIRRGESSLRNKPLVDAALQRIPQIMDSSSAERAQVQALLEGACRRLEVEDEKDIVQASISVKAEGRKAKELSVEEFLGEKQGRDHPWKSILTLLQGKELTTGSASAGSPTVLRPLDTTVIADQVAWSLTYDWNWFGRAIGMTHVA